MGGCGEKGEGRLTSSQMYAYLALEYGAMRPVAYVNLQPVPLANSPAYVKRAEEVGAYYSGMMEPRAQLR